MAFYQEDENELAQQDPNAPAQQQSTGQSGIISGQGAAPGAGAATPSSTPTPDNPGNFVGLKDYLNANKQQSSKLGNQVSGQVQQTIQGANEDVNNLSSKFKQQADEGQISNIGNAVNEAQNITQTAATGQPGAVSQSDKERFGQIANAQYQGPTSLQESELYEPTYTEIQKAQNYANLSKNEAGNQQLLKDIYKTPDYSSGENRLDSYLLESGENRAKLNEARQNAEGLDTRFEQAGTEAADYAAQQKALAESTRQAAQQNLTQTQTQRNQEVQADLNKIAGTWNDEQNAYAQRLLTAANGGNLVLTDEMMQKLGVTPDTRIYNILKGKTIDDIKNQYVTMEAFDPNKVISKEQQSQLAALDELANTYGGALQNKFTSADLAGSLNKATAFAADKFGLTAKEADSLFQQGAKLANMVSETSKSASLSETQQKSVTNYVTDLIERTKGDWWNPFKWFEEVTRAVTTILNIEVQLGNVNTSGKTSGTVADYLAGNNSGTYENKGGIKSLDWGATLQPTYLLDSRADNKINELQNQIQSETQANWTNQILNYLNQTGYNNQIKKG